MKLKTLKTYGKKDHLQLGDLPKKLYKEGTERVVIAYFLLPKTINNKTKRGLQLLVQTSTIRKISEIDLVTGYNRWHDSRFFDLKGPPNK